MFDITKNQLGNLQLTQHIRQLSTLLSSSMMFELVCYYKFVANDPTYQEWADQAFAGWFEMAKSTRPEDMFSSIRQLQDDAGSFEIAWSQPEGTQN